MCYQNFRNRLFYEKVAIVICELDTIVLDNITKVDTQTWTTVVAVFCAKCFNWQLGME